MPKGVFASQRISNSLIAFRASAYRHRRFTAMGVYAGATALAYLLAYLLRFEFAVPVSEVRALAVTLPVLLVIRLAFDFGMRLATTRWRFIGTRDVIRLVGSSTLGSITFWLVSILVFGAGAVPRSVIVLEWVIRTNLIAVVWVGYRLIFEALRRQRLDVDHEIARVLLVGAGEAGNMLVHEMLRFPTRYTPVGFVDDNPQHWGMTSHGVEVLGSTADLPQIVAEFDVGEIIIAIPSASPSDLRRVVERCEASGVPFKVLPGIREVLAGEAHVSLLREVQIEDLLGREPITLELPELAEDLESACVLITGAAGSIGSELSRQVALHRPRKLILLDQAETDLYYLELELRELYPDVCIHPMVADVVDAAAIDAVFQEHAPDRVFHAAAYKHVPMMEVNAREALRNNVLGTAQVANAAGRHGAAKFVLVSTDKAVRPVSIMGATKRLAEMLVLEMQGRYAETAFAAVRFGNVLGSNGSVIPLFKRQLAAGRPLTVTDPRATRYFMTISEAVQLILQASLLPHLRGHIAMLDMGEPVRIVDLASNLLRLSGKPASKGHLVFTGLRPGEKLHEELAEPAENTIPTEIPKVRLISPATHQFTTVLANLYTWEREVASNEDALSVLRAFFSGLQGEGENGASRLPSTDAAGRRQIIALSREV